MENAELINLARSLVGDVFNKDNSNSAVGVGAALLTVKGNIYSGICLNYPCSLSWCAMAKPSPLGRSLAITN